jgi:hypothetical protein
MVETRWDLVIQALMRALVVEDVAKVVEAALLRAKRFAGGFVVSSFSVRCIRS